MLLKGIRIKMMPGQENQNNDATVADKYIERAVVPEVVNQKLIIFPEHF